VILTFLTLAASTLVSEDLTSVLAGVLVAQGEIGVVTGIAACVLGIYFGDLLLFAGGRVLGPTAFKWRRIAGLLAQPRVANLQGACGIHVGALVLGSRFLPGTRLPLYVAAGAMGCSARAFAWWSAVAVVLWTPAVVLASANLLPWRALDSWPLRFGVAAAVAVLARVLQHALTRPYLKARIIARVSRLWRWEFWPMWVFYAPLAIWIAALVIRHRGFGVVAAANPGMPDGGIVGESKHDILTHLPSEWTIPSTRIHPGPPDERNWRLAHAVTQLGWRFPLVLKPDVGQRGSGVKLVRSLEDARRYLSCEPGAVLVQPYHPGPYEAGVFYYRMPWWPSGRILSITDKLFPCVVGDGRLSIRDLVWANARLRMQARTFLSRHRSELDRVPSAGECVRLGIAGNHCQGTLFRDGRHLITPALEERIDTIARAYHGFYIGRFDVRYSDVERFRAGEDLAIVELNGATAESTNIYDPDGSLIGAYRQLFKQWSLVFAIGAANRASGADVASVGRLTQLLRAHLGTSSAFGISD
jgi:membrane protein DedA with SNARE-associated domain